MSGLQVRANGQVINFTQREFNGIEKAQYHHIQDMTIEQAETFVTMISTEIASAKVARTKFKQEELRLTRQILSDEQNLNANKERLERLKNETNGTTGGLLTT